MTKFKCLGMVLSIALFSSIGFAGKTNRDGDNAHNNPNKKAKAACTQELEEEVEEQTVPQGTGGGEAADEARRKTDKEKARAAGFVADLNRVGPRNPVGAEAVLGLVTISVGKYCRPISDERLARYLLEDVIPTFGPLTEIGARARNMIGRMRMDGTITNDSITLDAARELLRAVIDGPIYRRVRVVTTAKKWLAEIEDAITVAPAETNPGPLVPPPVPGGQAANRPILVADEDSVTVLATGEVVVNNAHPTVERPPLPPPVNPARAEAEAWLAEEFPEIAGQPTDALAGLTQQWELRAPDLIRNFGQAAMIVFLHGIHSTLPNRK